jgi:hypothetical protein
MYLQCISPVVYLGDLGHGSDYDWLDVWPLRMSELILVVYEMCFASTKKNL